MKNFNLNDAIAKRRILPFEDGPKVVSKEIQTAKEDLKDAKEEFYDNFIDSLALREMADYKRKFSREGAQKNIANAVKTIKLAEKALKGA